VILNRDTTHRPCADAIKKGWSCRGTQEMIFTTRGLFKASLQRRN
jgi:hypothetical protein